MCAHNQQNRDDPEYWPSRILFMTLYAPQQGRNCAEAEKDRFYEHLQKEIDKLRQNKGVIVMGDLDGYVPS